MQKKIKKIIPYFLILLVLMGLFSPMGQVLAVDDINNQTGLYDNLSCWSWKSGIDVGGCVGKLGYIFLVALPSWLLIVAGTFFNAVVAIGLNSDLFHAEFVSTAWAVVRDLSNIFFILILLYVAIQTILGMGHETKKAIAKIVVMALLINFSMFFAKVVIDSSNVLALVFYNKIAGGNTVVNTKLEEKDISSRLAGSFNPSTLLSPEFFEKAKTRTTVTPPSLLGTALGGTLYLGWKLIGYVSPTDSLPIELTLGIEVVSGLIMLFATYCFFTVGLTFLSRLIELWILIIFSPFAFMSFALPKLASVSYIGWDEWSKRILKLSFMAPIFMFFLYLIFLIINANLFISLMRDSANPTTMEAILFVIIPGMVVLILLLKATSYAKKASGALGDMVINGAKLATGLAVGIASGGTAFAGRAVIAGSAAALSRRPDAVAHGKYNFELDKWKHGGRSGPPPIAPTVPLGLRGRIGAAINKNQWKSGDVAHARHEMDELKKKVGVEGLSDYQISGVDQERMKTTFAKDHRGETESDIRRGYDAKGKRVVIEKDVNGNTIDAKGENDYKAKRRNDVINEVKRTDPSSIDGAGNLNDQGQKKVEDTLNKEFNTLLQELAKVLGEKKYTELQGEAKEKVGIGTRLMAKSTSGTYDVRNLPNIRADKGAGLGAKATVGLIAAVAMGMRLGLKKVGGVEYGTSQGDVLKDLKDTVSSALKNVKINLSTGGEEHSSPKASSTSGGGHH